MDETAVKKQRPNKTRLIQFRVTEEEGAALDRAAIAQTDGDLSKLCRMRALSGRAGPSKPVPTYHAFDPALFAELRAIGVNLNQISHNLNLSFSMHNGPQPVELVTWRKTIEAVAKVWQVVCADEVAGKRFRAAKQRAGVPD